MPRNEYVLETFKHNGYTVKIIQDTDPMNPRENDNVGTMVCWHRGYTLGDHQPKQDPDEFFEALAEEIKPGFIDRWDNQMFRRMVETERKPKLLGQYSFTPTKYDTAEEKARVLNDWVLFLSKWCRWQDFTERLYHHLMQHCSFIAHYDRAGFYAEYFEAVEDRAKFLSQFDKRGPCLSVEYGGQWWIEGDYADLNRAMIEEAVPFMESLLHPVMESERRDVLKEHDQRVREWRIAKAAAVRKIIDSRYLTLPLGLIDHSGISMYVGSGAHSCDPGGWDSGQVGWIYCTKDKAVEEWGGKSKSFTKKVREAALKCLRAEVEEYDQYLRGDVYGYVIETTDGEHVDSCWGFFGSDYCKEEAKGAVPDKPAPNRTPEQLKERFWELIEPSTDSYSDMIRRLLEYLSDQELRLLVEGMEK